MSSPVLSYIPEPHERPYYEALFAAADTQGTGSIGGAQAVQFFGLSKLPVDALKNIWTLADQNPTSNSLDKRKFGIAVRLIQLQQNGQKAQGANLAAPPGVVLRPVMFEGVSGVSAPLPPAAGQQPPPSPMRAPTPQQQMPPQQQPMRAPTPQMQQPPPMQAPSPMQQPMRAPTPPPTPPHQPQQQSLALTTQDPYTMLPHDQSRYEALFPQYEVKKDGYVYGKEAVELFSKSGLGQDQLRDIWNMVDQPVDNRLDVLEFAMAMHLIVCISMKKLPMPTSLPYSLKLLKQGQQQQAAPQENGLPSPTVQQGPPSPGRPPLHPPNPGQPAPAMAAAAAGMIPPASSGDSVGGGSLSGLAGPPPIVPQGGTSITDAFEGLSTTPQQSFDSAPPQMPTMDHPSPASIPEPEPAGLSIPEPEPVGMSIPEPSTMSIPEPVMAAAAPTPAPAPVPSPPKDTRALAASYAMGDEHEELGKLKVTLQKLQAENISLKAQLGSMTDEEKEVHKEISATVAEIGKLSNDLTGLRAQVLAAKSHLLEATADLNKQREKKGAVTDLINEAQSTKEALDAANEAIENVNKSQAEPPAPAPAANFDGDLFGWGSPAPAPEPVANDTAPALAPELKAEETPVPQQDDIPPPPPPPPVMIPDSPAVFGKVPFGGSPAEPMTVNTTSDFEPPASAPPPAAIPTVGSAPSSEEIDGLKKKLSEAESTARDAEEQRRRLAEQADVLRREAEQADRTAKDKTEAAQTPKKRGFMRGKKKEQKEAGKLLQEAADKKRQFMEAQAAAQHASQVAMETKFEADKIRKETEKAELDFTKNASMMDTPAQPSTDMSNSLAPPPADKQPEPAANSDFGNGGPMGGYGGFGVMGGGGSSIPTPTAAAGDNDGGWGIMGGGGGGGGGDMGGIPTPPQSAAGDDPYANPF